MSKGLQLYRLINVLSLDVVVGAWVCALFFARLFSVELEVYEQLALGLTVWIIYTTDHLRDAKRITRNASTERHRFHQRHFNALRNVLIVGVLSDVLVIFFIREQVLIWGLALSFAVLVYLSIHRQLTFLKEVFIAILYTGGVVMPSLAVTSITLRPVHYGLVIQFGLLALTNLLIFSWFDRDVDHHDQQHSFVTRVGDVASRKIIWVALALTIALTLSPVLLGDMTFPAFLLGIMGVVLLLTFLFRKELASNDYYRLVGDAIFLLPAMALL